MLKFLFVIVLLYFLFVAVRNLARAVMADSYTARIKKQREQYYQPPRPSQRSYQEAASPPPPKTTIYVRQQPVRREHLDENVEDAKFTDL